MPTLTTPRLDASTLDGMNTLPTTTAPIAGLLSLVADALDPETSTTSTLHASPPSTETAGPAPVPDLTSVLGEVVQGWLAVKEDGHGWMLLHFVPRTATSAQDDETQCDEPSTSTARPIPTRPEFGARARRVHTALTEREREVLCLVAGGATNRAIGSRLYISPKTASVHVSRILTKLDATTRTEAAALAHASGLVQPWGTVPPQVVSA